MTERFTEQAVNVRCGSFFLAFASGSCTSCGGQTDLVAIGLPAGHERCEEGVWWSADEPVLLFDIEVLAPGIGAVLFDGCPQFRAVRSAGDNRSVWCNHCQSCGAPQADYWLHCEPGGAFLPLSPEMASSIDLIAVDLAFAARACGFSEGVPLPYAMRRSG